ncbi:tetratricopeptide repeat protein [Roseospira visakhapatnamensis]|uniref:Tetratricopeptide repeat protein n=1 Tax=Roseospira visakhapatnamensis TaxID=390880 RepID=A0A7W6RE87_9PROT|nr:tetratricopeptide repeat protein [Roseospira visakhapatnamensis]MBB4266730.1 hypothetical protein [Roseospira visakhapatnamensis]
MIRSPACSRALAALLLVAVLLVAGPSTAGAATVSATAGDGIGRIVFDWEVPVRYTVEMRGRTLVARFDAPVPSGSALIPRRLPAYVETIRLSGDRLQAIMPLKGDFDLSAYTRGSAVVIELRGGPPRAGVLDPPARPVRAAAPARDPSRIRVRTGAHDGFHRIVFDWTRPVGHVLDQSGDQLTLRFDRPVPLAVDPIRGDLPETLTQVSQRVTAEGSEFAVRLPEGAVARTFEAGPKVVLDITVPADAEAPEPEPSAPGPEAVADPEPESVPVLVPGTGPATPPLAVAPAVEPTPAPFGGDVPTLDPDPALAADARSSEPADEGPAQAVTTPPADDGLTASEAEAMPDPPDIAVGPSPSPGDVIGSILEGANPDAVTVPDLGAGIDAETEAGAPPRTGPRVVSLGFSWDRPTAAAVFRRAGYLWVMFDRFQEVDLSLLRRAGAGVVRSVEQVRIGPNSTLVRMVTAPGYNPSLRRDGLLWVIDLMKQPLRPERPIEIQAQPQSPVGARLLIPVIEGGAVIPVIDPELGDQFFALPVIQLGQGVYPERGYPDATLPVTAQGVVVVPHSDRIRLLSGRSGAEISADGGLTLSPDSARLQSLASLSDGAPTEIFNIPGWRRDDTDQTFHETLQELQRQAATVPDSQRANARLDLARFYFANGYAPEALGVLRSLGEDAPEMINTPAFRALRGATHFLMGRDGEAVDDLGHPSLADVDEAAFWRAAAQSRLGSPGLQAATLEATGGVLGNYPPDVRIPLALVAANAAIEAGDDLAANTFLEAARDEAFNTTHDEAALQYLEGKRLASTGAFEPAIAAWREAEMGFSRRYAALATRDRLDMEYRLNQITADELINGLELLRFAWRGGDFEYELLTDLGDLYMEEKRYGDALRTLRLAASYFQDRPGAEAITRTMRETFDTLFLRGAANDMSPLTAISLFDEFRELTPTGDRGDEIFRRLADRLVSVDLLPQAAGLLERQIRYRLRGLERTKVGARLALVYLFNRQPSSALEALDKTRYAPLPERLERQRRHLRARALADTNDPVAALRLLENDPSEDARVLRSEINWRTENWAEAARALAELVPPPPTGDGGEGGQALEEKDAFRLIDWATALTLAGDETGVSLLRRRYMSSLEGTPFEDAFDLVTASPEDGLIDIASVGGKIRQAERFRDYLTAYRDKLREERLSAIN